MSKLIICDEKTISLFFRNNENYKTLIVDLSKENISNNFYNIDLIINNISAIDIIVLKSEQNLLFQNNVKILSSKYNKIVKIVNHTTYSNYVDSLQFVSPNILSQNTKNNLINKYGLKSSDLDNIKDIKSTLFSFALLKNDGKVVTFGLNNYYSNNKNFYVDDIVTELYSNELMFCAKNIKDKFLFWGNSNSFQVIPTFVNVKQIFTNCDKFIALSNSEDVAIWGLQTNTTIKKPEYVIKNDQIYVFKNINEIYMGMNKNKNRNLIIDKKVINEISSNKENFIKLIKHALVN